MAKVPAYMKKDPPPFKNFFFLDGVLHKLEKVQRGLDIAICYNYGEHEVVRYHWHEVKKRREPAYSIGQVSQMVGRSTKKLRDYIWEKEINTPPKSWRPGLDESRCPYWFSQAAVKEVHSYIASLRKGNHRVPDPYTLRENMNKKTLYIKKDGEFVPIWIAED